METKYISRIADYLVENILDEMCKREQTGIKQKKKTKINRVKILYANKYMKYDGKNLRRVK